MLNEFHPQTYFNSFNLKDAILIRLHGKVGKQNYNKKTVPNTFVGGLRYNLL